LFSNQVKALTGSLKGDYRLRVGNRRILFTPDRSDAGFMCMSSCPGGILTNHWNLVESHPHLWDLLDPELKEIIKQQ
jgi:hypothetical protein